MKIQICLIYLFIILNLHCHGATQTILTNQELFEGKNITILGGTGYLGRAIATEILKYNPKRIIIFSRDEVKHFNVITKTFNNNPKVISFLGDIRDYEALLKATRHADIVFHVAALKRMDCLEDNVEEAIKTNVMATMNVFNACVANNVQKVLFISTDKACSPINTYGACKFVSEKIFTNHDVNETTTKFVAVRFGNILDSTGSVIPIFIDKIKQNQDIPLTDERMTRFIVDKCEAIKLIFDALRYGHGGEIFVKRLPAMRIVDLIDVLKTTYNSDKATKVIGLRPGEKIHEVMINDSEFARAYAYRDLLVITPSLSHWFENHIDNPPLYITRGSSMKNSATKEYTSGDETLSKDALKALLEKYKLLD